MYTNYDQLARLRIEEHEAHARQRNLQRIARDARKSHKAAGRPGHGGLMAHRRLIVMPFIVAFGSTAFAVLVR